MISFAIILSALILAWAYNPILVHGWVVVICEWIQSKFSKKEKKEEQK